MREALAAALSGPVNLDEQESRERPVDRLHALAAASRESHLSSLGVSFMGLRIANCPRRHSETVSKLFDLMPKKGITRELRLKISLYAVQERIADFCPRCHGKKEIPDTPGLDGAQRMKPCPPDPEGCGGSGVRRYSDHERKEALGLEMHDYRRVERFLNDALGLLNSAEASAVRSARRLLEKCQ